ncbi:lipopolysaccharide assembly protein LapA domain-containing protein [Pseudomonas sp. NPDC090755]|uniref:lipopolysaccharide assembly protein LapA domain-containing protein n=1 Tax=Pseudomonas sp. NPDC090755 TaxID=3364481 RepID=UPI00383A5DDF
MHKVNRLLLVLLLVLLVAVVLVFTLENQQVISLVFLGFALPPLPVALLLVIALVLGLLLGPVLGALVVWRGRHRIRQAARYPR